VETFGGVDRGRDCGASGIKPRAPGAAIRARLIGALAATAGAFAAASIELIETIGISRISALKIMFLMYALLGAASNVMYRRLPLEILTEGRPPAALRPSRAVVYTLAALFSIESFAGGFAVQSLPFGCSPNSICPQQPQASSYSGLVFCGLLIPGGSMAFQTHRPREYNGLHAHSFQHIPDHCGGCAQPGNGIALLLTRAALSQMDVPTRSSYVMAVATPAERPAAASVASVPHSLASAASPAIAGALFAAGFSALPLIICGVLKNFYDLALLWMFRNVRPPEERRR
jgi:hypothetical protein